MVVHSKGTHLLFMLSSGWHQFKAFGSGWRWMTGHMELD